MNEGTEIFSAPACGGSTREAGVGGARCRVRGAFAPPPSPTLRCGTSPVNGGRKGTAYSLPFTPAKAGAHHSKSLTRVESKRWVPAFAGMIGVLLMGCSEVSVESIWIEMPGEVITEFSNENIGVEVGMTESQVTQLLKDHGYTNKPRVIAITSTKKALGDCSADKPAVVYTYKKAGIYEEQEVEYVLRVSLADIVEDEKCEHTVLDIGPFQVRKPSYMEEVNAKNQ